VSRVVGYAFANGLGVGIAVPGFSYEHLMPDGADGAQAVVEDLVESETIEMGGRMVAS